MKTYYCYIKSHSEAPDYEREIEANSKKEAIDKIWGNGYEWARADWDKEMLDEYVEEEKQCLEK